MAQEKMGGVTRRSFVKGGLAASALAVLAGCGQKGGGEASTDGETAAATGGTLRYYINNPVCIDPFNLQEDQGTQVGFQLFDSLTQYNFEEGKLGAATYDSETSKTSYTFRDVIPGYFHGTGDVYASALVAAVMNGRSLEDAASIAVDFTVGSILRTRASGADIRFGVDFEEGLFDLTKEITCRN